MAKIIQPSGQFVGTQVSRRGFVTGAVTAGAVGAFSPMLRPGAAKATEAKKGGKFRLAVQGGQTTDTLDPTTFASAHQLVTAGGMYNRLAEVSNKGELVPELAEAWEPSKSADSWVFQLRRGIQFHNGKSLDSADVIASVNRHRGEDSKSAVKSTLASIAEIKADGPDKVVFKLTDGNADFPFILSDIRIPIMPAKEGNADWNGNIGTGGYILKSFEPGIRSSMERNPSYWKKGRAHFDSVEVILMHDYTARQNALMAGEIDAYDQADAKTMHLLPKDAGIRVEEVPGMFHVTFAMMTDTAPFDSNDVRMALKYGIDREVLLETILQGHGTVGNDHPISRSNRYYAAELEQRVYDPDKAKFHLKKAGLSNLKVDLRTAETAFTGAIDSALLYSEQARKANIEINVLREPDDGYWDNVFLKQSFYASAWSGRPTEDMMFTAVYAKDAAWNETHWANEQFNKLLKAARSELDEAKRREMYFEMQRLVRDEGGEVIPLFTNYLYAMSEKVQHDKMAGNWTLDGFLALERWWLA